MIEVVLLERIDRLGMLGDVVKVRPGFARNYLLPQKKALRATKANLAFFEAQRKQIEADNLARKSDAEKVSGKMQGTKLVIIRQAGDMGQLYGSVSARDIAAQLSESGFKVDKGQVQIDMPIKTIGIYQIKVRLHPEVVVQVSANVARSAEEADAQAKTGKAVLKKTEAASNSNEAEALVDAEAVEA